VQNTCRKQLRSDRRHFLRLAQSITQNPFRDDFIRAYVTDTAFTWRDVVKREIETPAAMLRLPRPEADQLAGRKPLGKVAILVPKNSLALTLVKAIGGAYLAGNQILVHLPAQLKKTYPIYSQFLTTHLPGVEVSPPESGSADFMRQSLKNPDIRAIVVYGDDAWIHVYHDAAEASGTKLIFEGPVTTR
jgi:acyl-CoA reductase-like NAD-dependent aldehyde dehydrogenase